MSIDNIVDIITIVISIVGTYIITRYSTNRPKKAIVKEKQFREVYLPLYKMFFVANQNNCIEHLLHSAREIIYANYELVFPQLFSLVEEALQATDVDTRQSLLEKIKYQVDIDYESLKKDLGLPSVSRWNLFKRKTKKDKYKSTATILDAFALTICPPLFVLSSFITREVFACLIVCVTTQIICILISLLLKRA